MERNDLCGPKLCSKTVLKLQKRLVSKHKKGKGSKNAPDAAAMQQVGWLV
jgi:hypothetical protein